MQRKQFLLTTLAAMPAIALAKLASTGKSISQPFIVPAGENRSGKPMMKYMGAHPNDVVISRHDTNNQLSVFLFTGFGKVGTPLHIHYHQDEFFTVIEGKYKFVCGDMKGELNVGDTIFLPRNIPHQWLQISDQGKLIYAVNPAGELEDFFKEVNDLKMPTEDEINKLALKHGVRHIGPPLSA
ncbi:cupin domain-containing protein [Chitinophaga silvatica]|uniref:Cupin domain-containing protein n=1 Tax=Chitinophaga silvatica TaxID=2282649 RepID=A0A3E1YDY8_9BACT|nr:cupin domain-containing protein [Chitinophaga silvatica]RFS24752.1 cupin domain-containing protein [Chitinophaga silvatica]